MSPFLIVRDPHGFWRQECRECGAWLPLDGTTDHLCVTRKDGGQPLPAPVEPRPDCGARGINP